jgi:hypothetical protein
VGNENFEVNRFQNYSFVVEHGTPAEHGGGRSKEWISKTFRS